MEDMEQYLSKVKGVQQESIQRIETLESQKNKLQGNVVIKEKEKEEVSNNTVFFFTEGKMAIKYNFVLCESLPNDNK
jgi:TolA-binding protein